MRQAMWLKGDFMNELYWLVMLVILFVVKCDTLLLVSRYDLVL